MRDTPFERRLDRMILRVGALSFFIACAFVALAPVEATGYLLSSKVALFGVPLIGALLLCFERASRGGLSNAHVMPNGRFRRRVYACGLAIGFGSFGVATGTVIGLFYRAAIAAYA